MSPTGPAGAALLEHRPYRNSLHAEKGCDANAICRQFRPRDASINLPAKANRIWKDDFAPFLRHNRKADERMFHLPQAFRCVPTLYDLNAANFQGPVSYRS